MVGALAVGALVSTAVASPFVAVTMPVGGVVDVPAKGVTQVDVAPAGVAGAWAGDDHLIVWGLQRGTATLVVTAPDGIEARAVRVMPADPHQALFAQGICSSPLEVTGASPANAVLPQPTTEVTWSPGEWQAFWNVPDSGGRVTASNTLSTPLALLGIAGGPGVDVAWDRWAVTATRTVGALAYQMPLGSGMMMVGGDTTLGPIGDATVAAGDVTITTVALLTHTGEVVAAAQTTLGFGPFGVGYLAGPTGGVPSLQFRGGSVTLSAANWPGGGTSVGLNLGLGGGASMQGTWGFQTGWTAVISMSLGRGPAPISDSAAAITGVILPAASCWLGFGTASPLDRL
ncbi:MAG TPA: hypothetical protein VEZ44_11700 [bacterium]|nr:hypothetical protein [bacterium]